MGQERLSSFTLLSIERVLNESIDFTPMIDKFATLIRGSNFPLYIGQNPWTPKFFFRSLRSLVYGILVHIINYILLTVFFSISHLCPQRHFTTLRHWEAGFRVHFEFLIFCLHIFVNNNNKYS